MPQRAELRSATLLKSRSPTSRDARADSRSIRRWRVAGERGWIGMRGVRWRGLPRAIRRGGIRSSARRPTRATIADAPTAMWLRRGCSSDCSSCCRGWRAHRGRSRGTGELTFLDSRHAVAQPRPRAPAEQRFRRGRTRAGIWRSGVACFVMRIRTRRWGKDKTEA